MKEKCTIQLQPLGKIIEVNYGTPLIDILHEYGIEFPCGGTGRCGKCKVKLLEGNIQKDKFHAAQLKKMNLSDEWRLACLSICTGNLTLEIEQFNHFILADESEYAFNPLNGFGVAVDLGTTTLVTQLVNLKTAKVMAVETRLNPQVKFGADLISRILHAMQGDADIMKKLIREAIGEMIGSMLLKCNVPIEKVSIVGNSVMQLIFSGNDVTPLASFPFETSDLDAKMFSSKELGWTFDVNESVVFFPSIGSFVGSDILAGVCATGIHQNHEFTALIDLGTNGEIVVGNKNGMYCASTAAGPAFEGANISMGMRATTGAISSLSWSSDHKFIPDVIGKTTPKGICGSALIDAIALLRDNEVIDMFGLIQSGDKKTNICGEVFLTQEDLNKFILAKSAIASGLHILADKCGIKVTDINEVYIAGGFGSYINVENVSKTGLITLESNKIRKIGNSALIGAKMFLFSNIEKAVFLSEKIKHVNLEKDANFQNIYVDNMLLHE